MKTNVHFWSYLAELFLEREMFQTKVVEKIKTHILHSGFFFSKIVFFYEIIWKKCGRAGRPQMTIWRMHIACWIPKSTNTHLEFVILIAFPRVAWVRPMLCYMYVACLVSTAFFFQKFFDQIDSFSAGSYRGKHRKTYRYSCKCPSFLSDCSQNCNMSTNFSNVLYVWKLSAREYFIEISVMPANSKFYADLLIGSAAVTCG